MKKIIILLAIVLIGGLQYRNHWRTQEERARLVESEKRQKESELWLDIEKRAFCRGTKTKKECIKKCVQDVLYYEDKVSKSRLEEANDYCEREYHAYFPQPTNK